MGAQQAGKGNRAAGNAAGGFESYQRQQNEEWLLSKRRNLALGPHCCKPHRRLDDSASEEVES